MEQKRIKIAIISTTVNDEQGYLPFDKLAAKSKFDACFIIAGDKKTRKFDTSKFESPVLFLDWRTQLQYSCSKEIGWNNIQRRNIALLEAIRSKPDYILSIDDDNMPERDYFKKWHNIVTNGATRELKSDSTWFNYLEKTDAPITIFPRGYPICRRADSDHELRRKKIPTEQIGLYQGLTIGDPDIDAMTRIIYPGKIDSIRPLNYCAKNAWSPLNTQNTLFSKKLFSLAFVWPRSGRYDDIYASFVWQRFAFNNGLYIHYGDPVNNQLRGKRDNLADMKREMEGYFECDAVWQEISRMKGLTSESLLKNLMSSRHEIIRRQRDFIAAWIEDLKTVQNEQ